MTAKIEGEKSYQPIENYGVIGDLRTTALVSIKGSIDYLCMPDFDSPSVFCSLLDVKKGGFFQIAPVEENIKAKQMYFPETNILLTRFLFENGLAELTDFMPVPIFAEHNIIIRKVTGIKGKIPLRMQCCPRFNYARSSHATKHLKNQIIFTSSGKDGLKLSLQSSIEMRVKNGDASADFILKPGDTVVFILENIAGKKATIYPEEFVESAFNHTRKFWKDWSAKSTYEGRWKEMVNRSALILKLLISEKHGAMIAAPTFALPEIIGGYKNYDYRYTWIRDSAFAIHALVRIGYAQEAIIFIEWIRNLFRNTKDYKLSPVYKVTGKVETEIKNLPHLEGYKQSAPVKIGNNAGEQLQLDIYGEFIDSIYLYDSNVAKISYDTWTYILDQVNWLIKNWKSKDHSIWEVPGKPQQFFYSKFMCWVAIDRAIKIANNNSFPHPANWIKERDKIYNYIYKHFWNKKIKAFTQYQNSKQIDASILLMLLRKFINPGDPRWASTLKRIEKELTTDCLIYRYKPEEDMLLGLDQKGEGTFTACSFWYIQALARSDQMEKAELYFDKMLSYANHLGLFSEQIGSKGEHLGNFPQAITHLTLISAALALVKRQSKDKNLEKVKHTD